MFLTVIASAIESTPLVKEPCDIKKLTWALTGYQCVRFRNRIHGGCTELLKRWGIVYQR
jgi:hypothetical protein